jgi:hypothetical protein
LSEKVIPNKMTTVVGGDGIEVVVKTGGYSWGVGGSGDGRGRGGTEAICDRFGGHREAIGRDVEEGSIGDAAEDAVAMGLEG